MSTYTTITMTWIPPSFAPQTYQVYRRCHRRCEQTFGPSIISDSSISSSYTFTGIDPGTYCIVGLYGIYSNETIVLGARNTTTFLSGKLCYIITISIIMLFSQYL